MPRSLPALPGAGPDLPAQSPARGVLGAPPLLHGRLGPLLSRREPDPASGGGGQGPVTAGPPSFLGPPSRCSPPGTGPPCALHQPTSRPNGEPHPLRDPDGAGLGCSEPTPLPLANDTGPVSGPSLPRRPCRQGCEPRPPSDPSRGLDSGGPRGPSGVPGTRRLQGSRTPPWGPPGQCLDGPQRGAFLTSPRGTVG